MLVSSRTRAGLGVLTALALCAAAAACGAGQDAIEGLLSLLPAALLLAVLRLGYAPGEAQLERLRARRHHHRASATSARAPVPRFAPRSFAGGGLLLALSLATRPPPAASPVRP